MIYNMIRNDADSWDLAQDVFIKAWKALPKFEGRSAFFTWLYRIAHNVTYDWTRKKKISVVGEFEDRIVNDTDPGAVAVPKVIDSPDVSLERKEVKNKISEAIDALSSDHKEIILLKEVDGLSYQEIAESVGCSTGTVMSRLFYARKKLKEILGDIRND
jgi:RNA polymerase sigma-70 factor (ECF subfamily)